MISSHVPFRALCLLAVVGFAIACSPTTAGQASGSPPILDGFDVEPKRVIEGNEVFTLTLRAHAATGTALRYEWQASAGELSESNGPKTTWRAVKPGGQFRPGRVRIEARVAAAGLGAAGVKGGTAYLTVGADGRASMDGWTADSYGDGPQATPTPGLTPEPAATPIPAESTAVGDSAATSAADVGASGASTPP